MSEETLIARIRRIISGFKFREFIADDVLTELADQGLQFNSDSARTTIHHLRQKGIIELVKKNGGAFVYRQPSQNFAAYFFAVAAGLEKYSAQYIAHEIAINSPWAHADALKRLPSVLTRSRLRQHIDATKTRPAVYAMRPRFYLDNLTNMPKYCDTVPGLSERIMQAFGRHCASSLQTKTSKAPDAVFDDYVDPIEDLQNRLDDKTQAYLNQTNRLRDLERQNKKLLARLALFEQKIDEKNRVNATLEKRLHDVIDGSRRPGSKGVGSFSLAELIQVERVRE